MNDERIARLHDEFELEAPEGEPRKLPVGI